MTMEQRKKTKNNNANLPSPSPLSPLQLGNHDNKKDCNNNISDDEDDSIRIRIKSNIQNSNGNDNRDVTLTIPKSFTVNQLKEQIRSSCFNTSDGNDGVDSSGNIAVTKDRYLRLICSGRLLAPDSINISEFKCMKDGSVIHAVLAAPGIRLVY